MPGLSFSRGRGGLAAPSLGGPLALGRRGKEEEEEEALRTTHLSIHPLRVSQTGRRQRERKREKDPIALREKYLACTFITQLSGQLLQERIPISPSANGHKVGLRDRVQEREEKGLSICTRHPPPRLRTMAGWLAG